MAGSAVLWTYVVTNTGNVPLTSVVITDSVLPGTVCLSPLLPPGASTVCSANGIATVGQYENIGTVVGQPPAGGPISDTDPSHYFGFLPGVQQPLPTATPVPPSATPVPPTETPQPAPTQGQQPQDPPTNTPQPAPTQPQEPEPDATAVAPIPPDAGSGLRLDFSGPGSLLMIVIGLMVVSGSLALLAARRGRV